MGKLWHIGATEFDYLTVERVALPRVSQAGKSLYG